MNASLAVTAFPLGTPTADATSKRLRYDNTPLPVYRVTSSSPRVPPLHTRFELGYHDVLQPANTRITTHESVCCHPIYSGRQVCGRTSRGHTGARSHRISTPSFCGACLNFSREKDSAVPFLRRPWKSNFVYPRIYRFPIVGHLFHFILFCEEKSQFV